MNIIYTGVLSSGKTLSMFKTGVQLSKERNKLIISNSPINYEHSYYMPNEKIIGFLKWYLHDTKLLREFFGNKVLLIDEAYTLIDARRSSSGLNELILNFLMMVGKLNTDVIMTVQVVSSMLDLRFREIANIIGTCSRIDQYGNSLLFEDRKLDIPVYIQVQYEFILPNGEIVNAIEIYEAEKYYKLYDTETMILLDRDKYTKR